MYCKYCKQELSEDSFYLTRSKVKCKKCTIKDSKHTSKLWKLKNASKYKQITKKYRQMHRIEKNEYAKKYYIKNKLVICIQSGIFASLKGKKRSTWQKLVGYDLKTLKEHLESLFEPGMNWNNYGKFGWHIDHIRPINTFNITSEDCEDFKKCWALENLRPLWWDENLKRPKNGKDIINE